jgi:hypothetical protein
MQHSRLIWNEDLAFNIYIYNKSSWLFKIDVNKPKLLPHHLFSTISTTQLKTGYMEALHPLILLVFYQQLAEHGTVTACPADKPYIKLGSTQCFNCQAPNNIFDLTTQECISCPGNTTLNTTTHQCQCPCDLDYLLTEEGLCIPKTVIYSNGDYLNIAGLTAESVKSYVKEIQTAQQ